MTGVDTDLSLEFEKYEHVAKKKAALKQSPENAGISSSRIPRRVNGQEISLSCERRKIKFENQI